MKAFVVGAGASGFLHALALRSAGVAIESVYDPHIERAAWLADLCAAPVATSLETDAEVVAICSPPAFHVEQAEALAREGRTTFVEKPIGCDEAELARLAACPGIVPILQWRAGRGAHELRAAFASGVFGERPRITCEFRLWRDADYWRARGSEAWPCGAMLSIGIHAVDLLLWSVAQRVVRSSLTDARERGALDLEFEDGTTAEIRIALDLRSKNDFRLRVRGPRASADLLATEEDPTATPLRWHGAAPPAITTGATGSPLLVPYVHAALRGEGVGLAEVIAAHAVVMATDVDAKRASRDRASREEARCSLPPGAPAWRLRFRCG